ncbi:MAG: hypothetical protein ABW078_08380 [Sedimenticola sp.]
MEKTEISALDVGMTFAQDVVDGQGRTLIAKGTEVEQKHIRTLKSWGIDRVAVTSPQPPIEASSGSGVNSAFQEELRQMLDQRFGLTNRQHPAIQELYDLCLAHALSRVGRTPP